MPGGVVHESGAAVAPTNTSIVAGAVGVIDGAVTFAEGPGVDFDATELTGSLSLAPMKSMTVPDIAAGPEAVNVQDVSIAVEGFSGPVLSKICSRSPLASDSGVSDTRCQPAGGVTSTPLTIAAISRSPAYG
jgi:hypothetical protein